MDKYIWYLWPTVCWKSQDYWMFKEEFEKDKEIFINSDILVDLGFLWIVTDYSKSINWILIPEKKPRKSKKNPETTLTAEQKESNRTISSFRVKVEHSIGLIKRFWVTTQVFRNKTVQFCDNVMEIACSIANLILSF